MLALPAKLAAGQESARAQRDSSVVVKLPIANASLTEDFSLISSVRELADGRVLIADEKDGRIVIADFKSGRVAEVGRKGSGPGEFRQLGRLWAIGGDSTLLKEPFAPRILTLNGANMALTLGGGEPSVRSVGVRPLLGADTHGGLVIAATRLGGPQEESLYVVRVQRASPRIDTITRVQSVDGWRASAGLANVRNVAREARGASSAPRVIDVRISAPDQIAVMPDGSIAIARANPYRVDWCEPSKACRMGPPIPNKRVPMDVEQQKVFLSATVQTNGWPPTTDLKETKNWPAIVPPFFFPEFRVDAGVLQPLPDGSVLVARVPLDEKWMRYDIVTRSGTLAAQLQIGIRERVVGFGPHSVYVTISDADGVQRLQRHSWQFPVSQSRR